MSQSSTNDSYFETPSFDPRPVFGWFTAFGVVAAATILGNMLTIVAFTRKQVQKKKACFLLVNLAITDLMVGCITIPLYIYIIGAHFWHIQPALLSVFKTADSITGLASIFSISVISLERLFSIGWPIQHRNSTLRPYIAAIITTWLYAGVIPTLQTFATIFSFRIYSHVVVVSLSTPLVVTVISYCLLWIKKRKYSARVSGGRGDHEDIKLARTLLIVTVVFFFTWTPFLVLSAKILYSCSANSCLVISPNILNFTKLLHYGNSCANPIIYTTRIQSFRMALKTMFHMKSRRHRRGNRLHVNVVAPRDNHMIAPPTPSMQQECSVSARIQVHLIDAYSSGFRLHSRSSRQTPSPISN